MVRDRERGYGISMIVIGILFHLLGHNFFQSWFKKTFFPKDPVEKNATLPYSSLRYKFPTEYDRENPVTQQMGRQNYKNFLKSKQV